MMPFRFALRQRVQWRDAPSLHPGPWVIVGRLYHERVSSMPLPGDDFFITYEVILDSDSRNPDITPAGVRESQLAPWGEEPLPSRHAILRCCCGAVVLSCACPAPWSHAPRPPIEACGVCTQTGGIPVVNEEEG